MKKCIQLFISFFKIGLFTFGGGYAMIPLIEEEIIHKRQWMNKEDIIEIIAISESTPGPLAINLATFIGYKQNNILGSIIATIGVILPSFIIILLVYLFLFSFLDNRVVQYALKGINCAVAILIIKAAFSLFKDIKKNIYNIIVLLLTIIIIITIDVFSFDVSSIVLILVGGILNIVIKSFLEKKVGKNDDLS